MLETMMDSCRTLEQFKNDIHATHLQDEQKKLKTINEIISHHLVKFSGEIKKVIEESC